MYTNLEQSKKLAEILPFKSADMHYYKDSSGIYNAIEQAKSISKEFEMKVCLTNPFNKEFAVLNSDSDTKEVFLKLKQSQL